MVSRHGCAPAIPSAEELDAYLERAADIPRPDLDKELNYLHRVTTRNPVQWDDLCILAFDHRKQFYDMAIDVGGDPSRIPYLKQLLVKATELGAQQAGLDGADGKNNVGVLIDDTYGQDALNDITGRGWWIGRPVEQPSSRPLELEGGRSISARLGTWPIEHIVKCLVFYHPEDSLEMRLQQERQIQELYQACCASGHEFLLEIIPPQGMKHNDSTIVDAMTRFYNLDIRPDWWKLPSPSRIAWQKISDLISERAPHCRGVVLLGLDAPVDELKEGFDASAGFDICKGFAIGRTIFGEPSRRWLAGEYDDQKLINMVMNNYLQLISHWRQRSAG